MEFYERASRLFCALGGYNPEESVPDSEVVSGWYKRPRWSAYVRELERLDRQLLALEGARNSQ